jgi:hypothetical protein
MRMSSASATMNNPALPPLPLPLPGAKPREIRAALHPEYREKFEAARRRAGGRHRSPLVKASINPWVLGSG